jgi:hypothetical protein
MTRPGEPNRDDPMASRVTADIDRKSTPADGWRWSRHQVMAWHQAIGAISISRGRVKIPAKITRPRGLVKLTCHVDKGGVSANLLHGFGRFKLQNASRCKEAVAMFGAVYVLAPLHLGCTIRAVRRLPGLRPASGLSDVVSVKGSCERLAFNLSPPRRVLVDIPALPLCPKALTASTSGTKPRNRSPR